MVHIICIIGAGHSGSTILMRLLGSFSGAVAVGEFRRIWAGGTP